MDGVAGEQLSGWEDGQAIRPVLPGADVDGPSDTAGPTRLRARSGSSSSSRTPLITTPEDLDRGHCQAEEKRGDRRLGRIRRIATGPAGLVRGGPQEGATASVAAP